MFPNFGSSLALHGVEQVRMGVEGESESERERGECESGRGTEGHHGGQATTEGTEGKWF